MLLRIIRAYLSSMTGRIFLVLLAGFLIAGMSALMFANSSRRESLEVLYQQRAAERVRDYYRMMQAGESRAELDRIPGIHQSSNRVTSLQPHEPLAAAVRDRLGAGTHVTAAHVDVAACYPLYVHRIGDANPTHRREWQLRPPSCWMVKIEGTPAVTLLLEAPMTVVNEPPPVDPRFLVVLALAALVLSIVIARVATAPLQRLRAAATSFGEDVHQPPVDEQGPSEVRAAAQAFNRMQAQLRTHMEERATMLAAISHDLQTPMTRMRLRLEQMPDEELRAKILRDWYAMRNLVDEGLSLARAAHEREPPVRVDLDSLIDTVVTDATDAGHRVTYPERSGLELTLAPNSIGRCLANLVNNAATHAGEATVTVERRQEQVVVSVLDSGPGIPEEQIQAVMRPFVQVVRQGTARGGTGLGLSIAKLLAERNGATLELRNRPSGGLAASVVLG